jgi:hypothetical protein
MKMHQKPGPMIVCFALLITITSIVIAGCVDTDQDQQNHMTPTSNQPGEHPVAATIVTTRTNTAPTPQKTAQPSSVPDPSTPFIIIDPISDKNIGDLLVFSGTTNMPERTWISLSRTFGSSGDEKILAEKQVLSGTNGINHWRFVFDSSGFRPGSYKITVATGNKRVSGSAQFTLKGTFLGTGSPIYYSGASRTLRSAGAPTITVQPVGDRQQGDVFLVSGTSSLDEGTLLICQIYPAYFEDKTKRPTSLYGEPACFAVDTIVIRDTGNANRWSCALDTEGYEKAEYIVNVSTVNEDFTIQEIFGSTHFTLR